jgi:hypothetical protein
MTAGRELDALIAEKVMGKRIHKVPTETHIWRTDLDRYDVTSGDDICFADEGPMGREPVPDYSSDIAAAWEVVEKLIADGYMFSVGSETDALPYFAQCWKTGGKPCNLGHDHIHTIQEFAQTAPLAICLVALKAVVVNHAQP